MLQRPPKKNACVSDIIKRFLQAAHVFCIVSVCDTDDVLSIVMRCQLRVVTTSIVVYCSDFHSSWLGLANSAEQYTLCYESKYLREIGQVLDYLVRVGVTTAVQESLKHTVLASM